MNFCPMTMRSKTSSLTSSASPSDKSRSRVHELHEFNPMLGHRGCRLGIVYPEISEMQARAIFEAAAEVQAEGIKVAPRNHDPAGWFSRGAQASNRDRPPRRRGSRKGKEDKIQLSGRDDDRNPARGACRGTDRRDAEFFSFGTNDLTQTALGMSRDDSGSFLPAYARARYRRLKSVRVDRPERRRPLMEITRDLGRKTRPNIKLGICGEHGGEPASVKFCHRLGLDYVSCSPFRIPIAQIGRGAGSTRKLNAWSHFRTSKRRANELRTRFIIRLVRPPFL